MSKPRLLFSLSIDEYLAQRQRHFETKHKHIFHKYEVYPIDLGRKHYHVFHDDDYACIDCGRRAIAAEVWEDTVNGTPFIMFRTIQNRFLTKDHIVPKSKGGSNHKSNLQTMCNYCNSHKSNLKPVHTFTLRSPSGRKLVIIPDENKIFKTNQELDKLLKKQGYWMVPNKGPINISEAELDRLAQKVTLL